jgi:hypothetical protein
MEKKNFYIIDSCSLIDLNRHNPIDVFPSLWEKIGELIDSNMMISHIEVFNEVTKQDDILSEWLKKYKKMFRNVTLRQAELVSEILKKYPSFVKIDKQYDADPWLIALAKEMQENPQQKLFFKVKRLIVTEESLRGNKIKIPFVCQEFGIECINRVEMFRQESWKF